MSEKKELCWFGPPYSYSGYALHNRAMLFELHKLGWDIRLFPSEENMPEELIGKDLLLEMKKNTHIDPMKNICLNLVPPPAVPHYGKYTILFTTLESKTVHEGFYNRCSLFDEVWGPCLFNIKSLHKAGIPLKKLHYCPEGVYPDFWTDRAIPHTFYKSDKFTFFFNGDWSYRKGVDILIQSYCKAFSSKDNVRLLILAHYQGLDPATSQERINFELEHFYKKYNIENPPLIEFIFDYIPDPQMPNLYKCADCYVSPTRGEAWGLPIIQAMSCGIPSIIPEWGGHTDFCNNKTSWFIKLDRFDTMHDKTNLTVDFYWWQLFPEPSLRHLIKLMRYAYDNPSKVRKKGSAARSHVSKNFDWSNSGLIADSRLSYIYDSILGR